MTVRDPISIDAHHALIIAVKGDPATDAPTHRIELDLSRFQSGRWALQLDTALARRREPAVILAQGVACLAVAWWAQLSPRSYMQAIRGAVFLSPLNIGFGQDGIAAAARLGPATRLPFPSIVASGAYPFMDRLLALADSWGSHFVDTDAHLRQVATNRHAPGDESVERLAALLPLLQSGGSIDAPPVGVGTVIDLHRR